MALREVLHGRMRRLHRAPHLRKRESRSLESAAGCPRAAAGLAPLTDLTAEYALGLALTVKVPLPLPLSGRLTGLVASTLTHLLGELEHRVSTV